MLNNIVVGGIVVFLEFKKGQMITFKQHMIEICEANIPEEKARLTKDVYIVNPLGPKEPNRGRRVTIQFSSRARWHSLLE